MRNEKAQRKEFIANGAELQLKVFIDDDMARFSKS